MEQDSLRWYENDVEEDDDYSFREYEVTSSPNDFNAKTIIDFIESGLFKIPGFQRNYVWDIKRASKLIESVIIGLPIPQVYLYEEGKNDYLVIDGQQRLLTIYFFSKGRFPKKAKRFELRQIFDEYGKFPEEYLQDNSYFEDFKLKLGDNKLHGLTYPTLGEFKNNFDFRTIRNVMIKQNSPTDDDSAMFEIFNRLNSGGVVLTPQEIRTSLYHSKFYNQIYKLNLDSNWRILLNKQEPDLHMKDVEIVLRGFALLLEGSDYSPSMTKFLNRFSKKSKSYKEDSLVYFKQLFENFCALLAPLGPTVFQTKAGKFSITVFESIFVAVCSDAVAGKNFNFKTPTAAQVDRLKKSKDFTDATQSDTTGKKNIETRIRLAKEAIQ